MIQERPRPRSRHADRPRQGRGGRAAGRGDAAPTCSLFDDELSPGPAAQPRGGRRAQDARPHAADPRHLRAARAHARGPPAGGAGAARLHAAAPDGQGRAAVAAGRRHRHAGPGRDEAGDRPPAHPPAHPGRQARDRARAPRPAHAAARRASALEAPVVALVGYTNAGKSTLFSALTRAETAVSDQLFMTLDPLVRRAPPGRRAGTCCWSTPSASSRSCRTRWWRRSGPRSRRCVEADLLLHVMDASRRGPRGARGGGGGGAARDRRRGAAAHRRCSTSATSWRRRARRRLQAGAARGRSLVSARTGEGLDELKRGAGGAPRPAPRAACACASRARDARGIAGVYTAGRVVAPRGGRRRGAHRGRDPGAADRALPGAPDRMRRARAGRVRAGARPPAACAAPGAARRRCRRTPRTTCSRRARPGELDAARTRASSSEAWRRLRGGDVGPRREAAAGPAARAARACSPAETALGYARLRGRAARRGGSAGSTACSRRAPDYVPALVGRRRRRAARRATSRRRSSSCRRARGRRPARRRGRAGGSPSCGCRSPSAAWRRRARRSSAGDRTRPPSEYRAALEDAPEVAGLRLELADLLAGQGDAAGAIAVLEADPTGDRQVLLRLARAAGRAAASTSAALEAYRRAAGARPAGRGGPAPAARGRAQQLELLADARGVPAHPRAAPLITRADLAALIVGEGHGARRALPPGPAQVAVDISGSWAREHILKRAGPRHHGRVPEPHLPAGGDRAPRRPGARRAARAGPAGLPAGAPRPALTDMSRSNLFYYAGRARGGGRASWT